MGFILGLILVLVVLALITYFGQFHIELDGEREKIIKDGLVTELINSSSNIKVKKGEIQIDKFTIYDSDIFWFPYHITTIDYYKKIGYVARTSKDYKLIKKLLKKNTKSIEVIQREKLGL
jgi:hypothetical protein